MSERMVQHKSSTLTWRSEMNKSKSQRQPQLATGVLSTSGEEGTLRHASQPCPTLLALNNPGTRKHLETPRVL